MARFLLQGLDLEQELQKELLVFEYESGTESLAEFCERRGIEFSTFDSWLKKFGLRSPVGSAAPPVNEFVSLQVQESGVASPGFGACVPQAELTKMVNVKNLRVALSPMTYEALVTEQQRRREADGRKTALADLYAEFAATGMREAVYEGHGGWAEKAVVDTAGDKPVQIEGIVLTYPDGTELRISSGADATFIKSLLPQFQRS